MDDKMHILLIEDNKADSRLIDIYLGDSFGKDYTLTVADILSKGLELLSNQDFDLIIVDLSLPDSSGINTFKYVHEAAREKPVIVLTGLEDESIGINTVKLGAQDFLVKGKLTSKTLKQAISYTIERYKLLKALSENAKKLEEKTADLLREKQKLAHAQKVAHIGSWEWNMKESTFTCSEELYSIFGLIPDKANITYMEFLDFVHPDEKEDVKLIIEQAITNLRPFDFFHRIIRTDNEVRDIHTRGEMLLDEQGGIFKIIGTEQDVTERKKEEELEKLAMVAVKSYNAVTIANKDGKIEWVNEGFKKLFGYKLEDVKGTAGEVLRKGESTGLSPDTQHYKVIVQDKKPLAYENLNYSKDGKEFWLLTSLTPILNESGEVEKIISIDSDISKQKKAERDLIITNEELNKAKIQLEESLKVKEQFLANMSHEIRTPMNAIIGFTNLLLRSKHTADESKQFLSAIHTSGENLLVIINDILDFSKLESGKVTFESIKFKLRHLMNMMVDLMKPKADEKQIQLHYDISDEITDDLIGDPTRLNQILINLVGNAIKFTNTGEVLIKVSKLNEEDGKIELKFDVKDTGIGIRKENLEMIFESFTQGSNDTTRKYGGTGLGLSITKQLIELQGGNISVSSEMDKGSTFTFNLKFKTGSSPKGSKKETDENNGQDYPLKGTRVLLVEDNVFNQVLAKKILENWQCDVDLAENGKIATEKAVENNYDIILMDIQLPEMDGYEATSFIRNKLSEPKSNVPIIAMTAHAFANEADKCFSYKMNDYISKPFTEANLYQKITSVLQSQKGA
jgi:PAS domain S-box-containing protein